MTTTAFAHSPEVLAMLQAGARDAHTIAMDLATMRDAIGELRDLLTEEEKVRWPAAVTQAREALLAEFTTEAEDLTDLLLGALL
jgi:hypothetical protein